MLLLFLFYVNALKHKSERGHFLKKLFFVVRLVRTRDFSQFSSTAVVLSQFKFGQPNITLTFGPVIRGKVMRVTEVCCDI